MSTLPPAPVATFSEAETETRSAADKPARGSRSLPAWLPVVLLALTLALVAVGVVFLLRNDRVDDSGNRALADKAATDQAISQVSAGITAVFSWNYANPATVAANGKKYLTGDAPAQYQTLLTALQKAAGGQKLTIQARVVSAGVTQLAGDDAQLLLFVDQQSTRASDGQSSVAAGQVQIGAVKRDGSWLISNIVPL